MTTIDMQTMRYINLLDRASRVKTHHCFTYNNTIIFVVPKYFVAKAIGPNAIHVKSLNEKLGKKIRILKTPEGIQDAEKFIEELVSPVKFKSLEIKEGVFVLRAGDKSKAALIGRNRKREEELKKIVDALFGRDIKIV